MHTASHLPGRGPTGLPLYLHVNKKTDDDDDACVDSKGSDRLSVSLPVSNSARAVSFNAFIGKEVKQET